MLECLCCPAYCREDSIYLSLRAECGPDWPGGTINTAAEVLVGLAGIENQLEFFLCSFLTPVRYSFFFPSKFPCSIHPEPCLILLATQKPQLARPVNNIFIDHRLVFGGARSRRRKRPLLLLLLLLLFKARCQSFPVAEERGCCWMKSDSFCARPFKGAATLFSDPTSYLLIKILRSTSADHEPWCSHPWAPHVLRT